jgi:hypothetical protein
MLIPDDREYYLSDLMLKGVSRVDESTLPPKARTPRTHWNINQINNGTNSSDNGSVKPA